MYFLLLIALLSNPKDPTSPSDDMDKVPRIVVPQVAFHRTFRLLCENYALYTHTPEAAIELRHWLDAELETLQETHGRICNHRTIFLDIDASIENDLWTAAAAATARTSDHEYIFGGKAYFKETFCIANQPRRETTDTSDFLASAESVCIISTTSHFDHAFAESLKVATAGRKAEIQKVPLVVRLLSAPAVGMIYVAERFWMVPKIQKLDRELMLLQRREAIRLYWIDCAYKGDQARAQEEKKQLRRTIQEEWQKVWAKRPVD